MNRQLGINWREMKTFIDPNLETIQMSNNGKMDKQVVIYSYKRILSNNKKEWSTDIDHNMDDCQKPLCWTKVRHQSELTLWLHPYKV